MKHKLLGSNSRVWKGCNPLVLSKNLPSSSATWLLLAAMLGGHDSRLLPLFATGFLSQRLQIIIIVTSSGVGDVKSIRLQLFLPPCSLWIPPVATSLFWQAPFGHWKELLWRRSLGQAPSLFPPPPAPLPCMREISCPLWTGDILQLVDKQHRSCLHGTDKETPESDPAEARGLGRQTRGSPASTCYNNIGQWALKSPQHTQEGGSLVILRALSQAPEVCLGYEGSQKAEKKPGFVPPACWLGVPSRYCAYLSPAGHPAYLVESQHFLQPSLMWISAREPLAARSMAN